MFFWFCRAERAPLRHRPGRTKRARVESNHVSLPAQPVVFSPFLQQNCAQLSQGQQTPATFGSNVTKETLVARYVLGIIRPVNPALLCCTSVLPDRAARAPAGPGSLSFWPLHARSSLQRGCRVSGARCPRSDQPNDKAGSITLRKAGFACSPLGLPLRASPQALLSAAPFPPASPPFCSSPGSLSASPCSSRAAAPSP